MGDSKSFTTSGAAMAELIVLGDSDEGTYCVRTASGSAYLVHLTPNRHIVRLRQHSKPRTDYTDEPVAQLRLDGEQIPLLRIGTLKIGQRGELWLDVRRDGIFTLRLTTPVTSISRLNAE